jgi:ribose 5-phosphate isomerase B
MRVALAADHGGYLLKESIKAALLSAGHEGVDVGCFSPESVDYPDFAKKAVDLVIGKQCDTAILVCGTGIGMSIVANRHKEIRAANCFDIYTATMSREHNNANVLCLGARVLDDDSALAMVRVWLATPFAGGRHQRRIEKFSV